MTTPWHTAHLYCSTPDKRPKILYSVYISLRNSWLSALKWEERSWPKAHAPAAAESQTPEQGLHISREGWAQPRENQSEQNPMTWTNCAREEEIDPRKAKTEKYQNKETLFSPPAQAVPALRQNWGEKQLPGHLSEVSVLIYKSERCYKLTTDEFLWWDNHGNSHPSFSLYICHKKCRRGAEDTSVTRGCCCSKMSAHCRAVPLPAFNITHRADVYFLQWPAEKRLLQTTKV